MQFSVGAHGLPQAPQLFSSLVRVEHVPPQLLWPVGQVVVHAPATQTWPGPHALKQVPQLPVSVNRFAQPRPH